MYLLYLGLPVLMQVPADKSVGYTAAVIVVTFIALVIIGMIGAALFGLAAMG